MEKHKHSVFNSEQELLKEVLKLHVKKETFDIDPLFYKGNFYKEIPLPKFYGDKRATLLKTLTNNIFNIIEWDATKLPFDNNTFNNIILDPPFVIANRKSNFKSSTTNFGSYKNESELKENYYLLLKEAYRILNKNGICIFKCQDFTDTKTMMTHCLVYNLAVEVGFYAKDLAILVNPKNKPVNNNLQQRHFRKIHSYF